MTQLCAQEKAMAPNASNAKKAKNSNDFIKAVSSKTIEIDGKIVSAMIDTGSDLNIVQMKTHKQLKMPAYIKCKVKFNGIGSENSTIGYFVADILLDGLKFKDIIYVIKDQENVPDVIIGLSLINQTKMVWEPTKITLI